MAMTIQQISPVAHLPLVLGVVRKLNVAALIDTCCPPHPAHVLSCGRGVEALLLAILDGHHALYKVGARLEERGMFGLDHGVGHFRPLSITRPHHLLAYHEASIRGSATLCSSRWFQWSGGQLHSLQ